VELGFGKPCDKILTSCFFCFFLSALVFLVSFCFCWVSYLAYPNLLAKKALMLMLFVVFDFALTL
jgi:hypothetical protein